MSKTLRLNIKQFEQKGVQFPNRCVCCGAKADGVIPVHIEHGQLEWELKIPYCHQHINQITRSQRLQVMAGILTMIFIGMIIAWLLIGLLTPYPIFAIKPGEELIPLVALMMGPYVAVEIGIISVLVTRQICRHTPSLLNTTSFVQTVCSMVGSSLCCKLLGIGIRPYPFGGTCPVECLQLTFADEQYAGDFTALNHNR